MIYNREINQTKMTTVELDRAARRLVIIDQTKLPGEFAVLRLHTPDEIFEAIKSLRVRGAPAIGVAAAIGIAVAAAEFNIENDDRALFERMFAECRTYLASSRPTAVNLFWALDRMNTVVAAHRRESIGELVELLLDEAEAIRSEDIEMSRAIGTHGVELFKSLGMTKNRCFTIMTHCNAGALAAVRYGTALAPVHLAHELGFDIAVYADETRPLLQGARLTAYELTENGIDTTVICDNMAAAVLADRIDAVIVGADRIAANGDAANKIGTRGAAIIARYYNVPFIVAAPSSTIDSGTLTGADIPIEQRAGSEISELHYIKRMTPTAAHEFNPAFDVTPASLITSIVTEKGIFTPPYGFVK